MRTTSKAIWATVLAISSCSVTLASTTHVVNAAPPATTPAAGPYTVVTGDTLWGIAGRMKVSLQALLDANHFEATSLILPGQRLTAPAGASTPAPRSAGSTSKSAATTAAAAAAPAAAGGTTSATSSYTIVAGDYLLGIARRFAVPFGSLLQANGLVATSLIIPGRQITIPAGAATAPTAAPSAARATTAVTTTTAATTVRPIAAPVTMPNIDIAPTGNAQLDTVLAFVKSQLGKPYIAYSVGPAGYDCSGLVMAAYNTVGVKLIHQSRSQAQQGTAVDWMNSPILAGDLVFTAGSSTPGIISHVGIAISSTQWVSATRPGAWVSVGSIPAKGKILAVRRYIGG